MSPIRTAQILAAAALLCVAPLAVAPAAGAAAPHGHTRIAINHHVITVGRSAVVHGYVRPKQPGQYIYLQRRAGGTRWVAVARHRLGPRSHFSFTVRPAHTGTRIYRVVDPSTRRGPATSHSARVVLHVHPKPTSAGSGGSSGGISNGNCTPGYSPCIPISSDVDCAGGSGNGPVYVSGPVYVTGSDPYDLDRDGDGIACES
ncbi:MAG TPA: excalibur calcium-binding domain-containing protein [Jatrophihabitantaceae bacterium]|jgi:hypothetical protein